ncbi:MAG: hypothetical protein EXR99_13835 [Gemmataceae bacterium]|nr:hypothetical protein [Gemmataceae bacterium]
MSQDVVLIRCPECNASLKVPASIAPGKKIKCPKCSSPIVMEKPGSAKPSGKSSAPPGKEKKAVEKKAPEKKPSADEDGDDSGTYILRQNEESEEEKERAKVNYIPEVETKDLRGPAQAQILKPSNIIIFRCIFCCGLCLMSLIVAVWPFLFQEDVVDYITVLKEFHKIKMVDAKGDEARTKHTARIKILDSANTEIFAKNVYPEKYKNVKESETAASGLQLQEDEKEFILKIRTKVMPYRVSWIIFTLIILIYNIVEAMGAVRMQQLESYRWSIAAAVMGILPVNLLGLLSKIWSAEVKPDPMTLFPEAGFDMLVFFTHPLFLISLEYVGSLMFGILTLSILLREDVKEGFAYKGEHM